MTSIKVSLLVKFSLIYGAMGEYKIKDRKVYDLFVNILFFINYPQPAEEGEQCVAIHSLPAKRKRMPSISFEHNWCDLHFTNTHGAFGREREQFCLSHSARVHDMYLVV
jgi:hypothetical protein